MKKRLLITASTEGGLLSEAMADPELIKRLHLIPNDWLSHYDLEPWEVEVVRGAGIDLEYVLRHYRSFFEGADRGRWYNTGHGFSTHIKTGKNKKRKKLVRGLWLGPEYVYTWLWIHQNMIKMFAGQCGQFSVWMDTCFSGAMRQHQDVSMQMKEELLALDVGLLGDAPKVKSIQVPAEIAAELPLKNEAKEFDGVAYLNVCKRTEEAYGAMNGGPHGYNHINTGGASFGTNRLSSAVELCHRIASGYNCYNWRFILRAWQEKINDIKHIVPYASPNLNVQHVGGLHLKNATII